MFCTPSLSGPTATIMSQLPTILLIGVVVYVAARSLYILKAKT